MPGKMDCFGVTDVGRSRPENEDQFMIADLNKSLTVHQTSLNVDDHSRLFGSSQGKLLIVADGMGGHAAGARASALAVDTLTTYVLNTLSWLSRLDEQSEDDFKDDLRDALQRCQQAIISEAEAQPQRAGMGTTLTMAYVIWPRLYVVHAGDSRCYLLHGTKLKQITRDHSMAQLQRETTEAPTADEPPEDEEGPESHVLWNALGGTEEELTVEVKRTRLGIGDSLLLCTDGLTRHVPRERIAELLRKDAMAEQVTRQLVDEANAGGGSDNITAVVARFRESGDEIRAARQEAIHENPVNIQLSRSEMSDPALDKPVAGDK